MDNPTLHSRFNLLSSTRLPEVSYQSDALASIPLGINHRVILTALAVVTPLLVLVNCLDQSQAAFVAVPMQSTLAITQLAHSGHDYLSIYTKLLRAYAPPGHMTQPRRCQPIDP